LDRTAQICGFNTDILVVDTALLKSLDLRHAHVGRLWIQNAAFDGGVRLENVHSGSVKINSVSAKNILLSNVSVSENNSELVPRDDKRECSMSATIARSEPRARETDH
jgi:hypothetical protein